MWNECDGKRPVAVDVLVDVQFKDSRAEVTDVRADHIVWAHVSKWRVAGWVECSPDVTTFPPSVGPVYVEIVTRRGHIGQGRVESFRWGELGADTILRYRIIDAPAPVAADDWIEWHGVERPVDPGTLVEVRLRDGTVSTNPASNYRWCYSNVYPRFDVVAYRVVVATPTPADTYRTEAVAEHDRLTGIIAAKDAELNERALRIAMLENELSAAHETAHNEGLRAAGLADEISTVKSTAQALIAVKDTELHTSRDACAILESENATLRDYGARLAAMELRHLELKAHLNIAMMLGCLPLDFDTQLPQWVAGVGK